MNEKFATVRNIVAQHKVAIAVTVTAVACIALNRHGLKQMNEFLKEHNLYDEYYTPEA